MLPAEYAIRQRVRIRQARYRCFVSLLKQFDSLHSADCLQYGHVILRQG